MGLYHDEHLDAGPSLNTGFYGSHLREVFREATGNDDPLALSTLVDVEALPSYMTAGGPGGFDRFNRGWGAARNRRE